MEGTAKKTHKIKIGGADYTLCFNMNALSLIQEETGGNPYTDEFWDNMGPFEQSALLYGALNTYHPNLSMRDVKVMVGIDEIESVFNQVLDAWEKSQPDEKEPTDEQKKIQKSGGKTSGQQR